jgi:hypothetical protein
VFDTIQANPGCSKKSLREKFRASKVGASNTRIDKAVEELIDLGAVRDEGGRHGHRYCVEAGWNTTLFAGELRSPAAPSETGPDSHDEDAVAPDPPAAERKSA